MSSTNVQASDALHEHQLMLEELFSKNQLMPRIKAEFQNSEEFDYAQHMTQHGIPIPFGMDLLAQMVLHKRANLQTMVGVLSHHFDSLQETADALETAARADLVDWDDELRMFIVIHGISDDVQAELDRFQFPLPMVVEPSLVTHNKATGYLKGKGSVILRDNHHEEDVCLDHINRLNQMALTINQDVVAMVKNSWRNLDRPKDGETMEDYQKRKRAFEKYDATSKDVMEVLMAHSDRFYLTHRYDKRGRTYCMGYHVTYQGNPWNKACIEFADKEYIEQDNRYEPLD
jgi:hypothetical protein